jgi:hypothetical protein
MNSRIACLSLLLLAGCAKSADEIGASYISPLQYQHYSCNQLVAEAQRIHARAAALTGVQDKKADNDAIAAGVAVVLFWPALFLIDGDGQTGAELARLKGETEAIHQAAIQKNCTIQFQRG